MKPSPNELTVPALSALATQRLAKFAGKTFTHIAPSAEDYTADGEKAFLFIATPPDDPNGKSFSVALTASGKELNAADAGKLFLPHLSIDPSLLIAIPLPPNTLLFRRLRITLR